MTTRTRFLASLLAIAFLALGAGPSPAQEPKDDALDRLLEKLEDQTKPPQQPGDPPPAVAPGDQDLDRLLEKLGESPDTPDTTRPAAPGGPGTPPPDGKKPEGADALDQTDKSLDEHLEELLGRKKRDPNDQADQPGQESGPLAEAIKKMDEARQRLARNDTGADTRKTQGEVIRELDTILEQLRKSSGSGKRPKQQSQQVQQAGNTKKPGNQPGDQPNDSGEGTGPQAPRKPSVSEMLAGQKDTWGDLPPYLRAEMENVFREEMLPAKRDLIIRYYSAVARKGRSGGQ